MLCPGSARILAKKKRWNRYPTGVRCSVHQPAQGCQREVHGGSTKPLLLDEGYRGESRSLPLFDGFQGRAKSPLVMGVSGELEGSPDAGGVQRGAARLPCQDARCGHTSHILRLLRCPHQRTTFQRTTEPGHGMDRPSFRLIPLHWRTAQCWEDAHGATRWSAPLLLHPAATRVALPFAPVPDYRPGLWLRTGLRSR
jgi:hypothetical protein